MRSPPSIPRHIQEPQPYMLQSHFQMYEKQLSERERKLQVQAEEVETQLGSLEGKLLKYKNLHQQLKDTEGYLISRQQQLETLQTKYAEYEQKCASLRQQNEFMQQTITNSSVNLKLRESQLNQRQQALESAMNEAEKIKLEADAEKVKFSNMNKAIQEQQNLLSYQYQNLRILEQKMRECIRQSEEKAQYAEIQRIESEKLIQQYGYKKSQLDTLVQELEARKSRYEECVRKYEHTARAVAENVAYASPCDSRAAYQGGEDKCAYYQNVAATLLAENRRLKSKIESMEAKTVILAESPQMLEEYQRQLAQYEKLLGNEKEDSQEARQRIEDAFRIKENELNRLIYDAKEIRKQAELGKIKQEKLEEQQSALLGKQIKQVQFAFQTQQLRSRQAQEAAADLKEQSTPRADESISLPDPSTLTLRKTEIYKFTPLEAEQQQKTAAGIEPEATAAVAATTNYRSQIEDLHLEQLAGYSKANNMSLTSYVHNIENAVNQAVRQVDNAVGDISAGKFKI